MISKSKQNLFTEVRKQARKIKKNIRDALFSPSLHEQKDYCENFLKNQAKKEIKDIMLVIGKTEYTTASYNIIKYFDERGIFIKYILQDKDLIQKANELIEFLREYPQRLDEILIDQIRLKKAFAVVKFYLDKIEVVSIQSYIINDSILNDIYEQVADQRSTEWTKEVEMRNKKVVYMDDSYTIYLQNQEEESKFDLPNK